MTTGERDRVRRLLTDTLDASGLEASQVGEDRWLTVLAGEWKRTIPVQFHLDERSLRVTSLLAGRPDERHADVYRILLQRNQRPLPVHFAVDDEGDLILTGAVPLEGLDTRRLDEVLGAILTLADETFNQVLRAGFAGYLDAEQRWRAKAGLPPNPAAEVG